MKELKRRKLVRAAAARTRTRSSGSAKAPDSSVLRSSSRTGIANGLRSSFKAATADKRTPACASANCSLANDTRFNRCIDPSVSVSMERSNAGMAAAVPLLPIFSAAIRRLSASGWTSSICSK